MDSSSKSHCRATKIAAPVLAFLLSLGLLVPGAAHAAKFANQFCEFELPPQWTCNLEGAEWVCQSTDELKKRDAIIILAAKLKGDIDSLPQYLSYLKQPKAYVNVSGKNIQSEPVYAKEAMINNHQWIDSIHKDSEIPGFLTRYLATTKQDIAVLVTYSISKAKYQDYLADFDNMIKTLTVFRKAGTAINAGGGGTDILSGLSGGQLPQGISEGTVFPDSNPNLGASDQNANMSQKEPLPILPIALGAAVVLFILWRRRQG